ncbi:MAG TPA: phenylalanine--tRNA ligase beta subunit-related protein [Vicinamibacteria bacterium]|nr:phenylalanine--tRNA ligase beta subunit-related protein [Vicinamibacteria bacterium]
MSAPPLEVTLAPEMGGRVKLGIVVLEGVTVRDADERLAAEIEAYGRDVRERYGQAKSAEVPGVEEARTLYKALGMDPTKTRPSNESLLRRVLKGEALYRVNTLVDALNLCSLRYQLPFGLYDLDQVVPPVVLRRGTAGEAYEGIRKAEVHLEGRPVLVDAHGPFGNPTSDSARTMVTPRTRRALVTVYAPGGYAPGRLEQVLDGTEATLTRACGGARVLRQFLPA